MAEGQDQGGKVKENDECLDEQEITSHCASISLVLSPNIQLYI
ncbi:hypothetical protein [Coleofasciculus sp.]